MSNSIARRRYIPFPKLLKLKVNEFWRRTAYRSSDIDFHRVGRFSIRRQNDVHYFPRPARSHACLAALTDPPKVTTIRKKPKNSRNKRIFCQFASLYYVRSRSLLRPDRSSISD